jgi:hypothetical protein
VASRVASVKVVQHAAEVVLDVVVGGPRATERRSGRGEAAVSKEGVHCGEGNGVRQAAAGLAPVFILNTLYSNGIDCGGAQ